MSIKSMIKYYVVEGEHHDPNEVGTMKRETRKNHGPYNTEAEAVKVQKELMMKNVDNYYHKAWVTTQESHEIS